MKIFFQANPNVAEELKVKYQQILKIFQKNEADYLTNLEPERLEQVEILIFNQIQAVIIEGTKLNPEANYILALALSQKKPILFLLNKGSALSEQIKAIIKNKKLTENFLLCFYNEKNLEKQLNYFFDYIGGARKKELATIKFTLRLTPKMERYLSWKIANTTLKKADYLRNILGKVIEEDEEYKKFLRSLE